MYLQNPLHKSTFSIKEKSKSILSIVTISNWVKQKMYLPLKDIFTSAHQSDQLEIVKQNWKIVTLDPWVLQTIWGYSLELITASTHLFPQGQLHLPESQRHLP